MYAIAIFCYGLTNNLPELFVRRNAKTLLRTLLLIGRGKEVREHPKKKLIIIQHLIIIAVDAMQIARPIQQHASCQHRVYTKVLDENAILTKNKYICIKIH